MSSVEYGIPIFGKFASVLDTRTTGTPGDRPAKEDTGKGMIRTEFPDLNSKDATLLVYNGDSWDRVSDGLKSPSITGDMTLNGMIYTRQFENVETTAGSSKWLGKLPIEFPCEIIVSTIDVSGSVQGSAKYVVNKSKTDISTGYWPPPMVSGSCATSELDAHTFMYSVDGGNITQYNLYFVGVNGVGPGILKYKVSVGPIPDGEFTVEPVSPTLYECVYGLINVRPGDRGTRVLIGNNTINRNFDPLDDSTSILECERASASIGLKLGSDNVTNNTGSESLVFIGRRDSFKFMTIRGVNTSDGSFPIKDELNLICENNNDMKLIQVESRSNIAGVPSPSRPTFNINGLSNIVLKTNRDGSYSNDLQFYSEYIGDFLMKLYNGEKKIEVNSELQINNQDGSNTYFNFKNSSVNYIGGSTTQCDSTWDQSSEFNFRAGLYNLFLETETDGFDKRWNFSTNTNGRLRIYQPETATGVYIDNDSGSGWVTTSDIRFKKDIEELSESIEKVRKICPISYRMKNQSSDTKKTIGFSAQEIQSVLPEAVSACDAGELGVSYQSIIPVLLGAIKDLDSHVQILQTENKNLKNILDEYCERMQKLETKFRYR